MSGDIPSADRNRLPIFAPGIQRVTLRLSAGKRIAKFLRMAGIHMIGYLDWQAVLETSMLRLLAF